VDDRQPVFLFCPPCKVAWVVGYLPMPVGDFAKRLKQASCPKCGKRKEVRLLEPGTLPAELKEES
jgi:hypothetical protein